MQPSGKHRVGTSESLYVFDVDISCESTVAFSASDHSLHLLHLHDLRETLSFNPHSKTISCIEFSRSDPRIIYTSSADKTAAVWDMRNPSHPSMRFTLNEEAYSVSCSFNDSLLAIASGNGISFKDIRHGSKSSLGEYSDVHTDLVTAVKFSADHPTLLISGGEDGLVNVYDTAVTSGEAAVQSILNVDCPLRKIGFFQQEGVYCLTSTGTASFWHHPSAQRIGNFTSVREDKSVDYLTDCFIEPSEERLFLVAGKFSGEGCVLLTEPSSMIDAADLNEGHKDIIRGCSFHASSGTMVTGGEDGCVCSWDMRSVFAKDGSFDGPSDARSKRRKTNE